MRQQLEQYFIEVVQSKLKDVLQLFQDNTFTCSKPIYHFFTGGLCSMILYQINYEKEEKIKVNAAEFAYLLGNPVLLG